MKKKSHNGLVWYEFDLLAEFKEITHGVFTRCGGVSLEPFKGLNISLSVGDDPSCVAENKKKIKDVLKISSLVMGLFPHKDQIYEVKDDLKHDAILPCRVDGYITKKQNIGLCVTHADCQAALFYDPKQNIIANVHCGWRGNVLNIYKNVCVEFEKRGSNLQDIRVCISPSLGPRFSEFIHYKTQFPHAFFKYQVKPYFFNLWDISYHQLKEIGVRASHIEMAELCTYAMEDEFYSYRRDKVTGRNATVIAFKRK